jgi:hypothetical protein
MIIYETQQKQVGEGIMIAFDLQCSNGHQFEGWFADNQSFSDQKKWGLISCPVCEDTAISRMPSTFAIKGASTPLAPKSDSQVDMVALGKKIADYVENNFDNVGADFTEEALKMHYGVKKPKNIRGVSTPQEEETLRSQGINFFKFPVPSDSSDPDAS